LIYETDLDSRLEIQDSLDPDYLAELLRDMPEDEATDILLEHPEETRDEILEKIPAKEANIIKDLISYGEETAGGLMQTTFNRIHEDQTAADIIIKIKQDRSHESSPYFYVVNDNNELLGYFRLRDILNVSAIARPSEFMREETPKALLTDSCDKVANLMDQDVTDAMVDIIIMDAAIGKNRLPVKSDSVRKLAGILIASLRQRPSLIQTQEIVA